LFGINHLFNIRYHGIQRCERGGAGNGGIVLLLLNNSAKFYSRIVPIGVRCRGVLAGGMALAASAAPV
jgi:hypothetical protein